MGDKILISLEVPAVSLGLEIYVPEFLKVGELLPLLVQAVEEMSLGRYVSSGSEFLCLKTPETLLNEERTLPESGIGNGAHLLLL